MATKAEITKLVRGLEGSYPGQCAKWSEALWAQVYHDWNELLAPVPLPLLEAAVKYCKLNEEYFPQPNKIVAALKILWRMAGGVPTPEDAWQEARALIGKRCWWSEDGKELVGRDVQESDCSHPLVFAAIASMVLRDLRASDNDVWVGREFRRTYERVCSSQQQIDVVRALLPEMQGVPRLTSKAQPVIAAETGRF